MSAPHKEIERKFLVVSDDWRGGTDSVLIRQGFLSTSKERTVRVRVIGEKAFLTVKGLTVGITRSEFEYEIPKADAEIMLQDLCEKPLIEKRRYMRWSYHLCFEIDEFLGENEGLVIAELELSSETQTFERPSWLGAEVSHDPRYYNANLIKNPYSSWKVDR